MNDNSDNNKDDHLDVTYSDFESIIACHSKWDHFLNFEYIRICLMYLIYF